jgi:hypothetical protein
MAKHENDAASAGFRPIEIPTRDETVGFTPIEYPSGAFAAAEDAPTPDVPAVTPQAGTTAKKKED